MVKCKNGEHEIFKRGDAWVEEERRGAPEGGFKGEERRRPAATTPPTPQPTPAREHFMNRRLFGGKRTS